MDIEVAATPVAELPISLLSIDMLDCNLLKISIPTNEDVLKVA